MKKWIVAGLFALASLGFSDPHEHERFHHEQMCISNWQTCQQFKLEMLKIRERYLQKERECVEKAKDYWSMKECMANLKVKKQKEMWELMQKYRKGMHDKM